MRPEPERRLVVTLALNMSISCAELFVGGYRYSAAIHPSIKLEARILLLKRAGLALKELVVCPT